MERTATQCRDCNRRYIGCHGRCQIYKDYKQSINKASKQKQENYKFEEYLQDAIKRMKGWFKWIKRI